MSCTRCVLGRNEATLLRGAEAVDPLFPASRLYGTSGAFPEPPAGFERPRICLRCGVVYYPHVGTIRRQPGSCSQPECTSLPLAGSDYCQEHQG